MASGNLPDVVQLLLCEGAAYDESRNAWVLVHPVSQLHNRTYKMEPFPHTIPHLVLYFQLTGFAGTVKMQVKVKGPVAMTGLFTDYVSPVYDITIEQPTHLVENVIRINELAIIEEGRYEFLLFIDGQVANARSIVYLQITGEKIA